jgi:hypothetical protein
VEPLLSFVNSATKPSGNAGSTVIIEGDAFADVQGPGRVLFSDGAGGTIAAAIAAADDWTNTFIVTTVPSNAQTGPVLVETATGQSSALPFTVTQNAIFSPSTISWSQTQDLPAAVSGHRAVFAPIDDATGQTIQYVYTIGGASADNVPRVEVDFAVIQNDGALSGWTQGTDLPAGRAFHAAVAATPFNSKVKGSGFLYILGGIEQAGGQPVDGVFALPLNDDGTTASLPAPLHSFGAVIFRSTVYVVGGATTDHAPVASVYRAKIDTLGALSAWEALPALPSARAYHRLWRIPLRRWWRNRRHRSERRWFPEQRDQARRGDIRGNRSPNGGFCGVELDRQRSEATEEQEQTLRPGRRRKHLCLGRPLRRSGYRVQ